MGEDNAAVSEPVEIVPYDPEWPMEYEKEKTAVEQVFADVGIEVHHIGSTAVPDLAAKPIIDLLVAVESLEDRVGLASRLSELDYVNVPYEGDDKRLFFKKGVPRTHHVHIVRRNSWTYWKHIIFRDMLISNPELRHEYEMLKRKLAAIHRDDREVYSNAKTDFIERAVAEKARGK